VSDSLVQHLKNEAAVVGQVILDTPGAVWDELRRDWNEDRGNLLKRAGSSAGIGAGLGVVLSRSPVLGGAVLAAGSLYYGLRVASGIGSVVDRAWDADTESERKLLVQEAAYKVGREGATTLETMPAFMAGGGAGIWASRRVAALDRLAFKVTEAAEFPARRLVPEKLSWIGPGSERLPKTLMRPDGALDVFKLSEILAARHPWKNVEVIRSVRLSDMKASRARPGTPIESELGFLDRPGHVVFHSHPSAKITADGTVVPAARPSIGDLAATTDVGIIQSGELTTIYKGAARQFRVPEASFRPTLKAVVIDRKNQLAVELGAEWSATLEQFRPQVPRPLDYSQTVKVLSNWDKSWTSIANIPTASRVDLSQAMIELLKLGVH
jgi:hypothetical protein